ncbi:hypothetical protein AAFF_G00163450 [Aldrovandia affinis]|uniref:Ig-like domain-containing protein n=1 Tax=Aldrovandia affinis TaxID=143900 RepID=A0AAD7WW80_9TELE|nr:hypothetical protein AAFF_G00163450 [Aldrovandia affinis]
MTTLLLLPCLLSLNSLLTDTQISISQPPAAFCLMVSEGVTMHCGLSEHCGDFLQRAGGAPSSPVVTVLTPSREEMASTRQATLICLVSGFYPYPVRVSWTVDGHTATGNQLDSQSVYSSDKTYSMSSTLVLSRSAWDSGEVFTCAVQHESLQAPESQTIRRSQCSPE